MNKIQDDDHKDLIKSQYLISCDIPVQTFQVTPFIMIIFGGRGDLSRRKLLPTLYFLFIEKKLPEQFIIMGMGSSQVVQDEDYRQIVKKALSDFSSQNYDEEKVEQFIGHTYYQPGDFKDDAIFDSLSKRLKQFIQSDHYENILYYMAVPPHFFPVIIQKIEQHQLNRLMENTKIIIEKPFGTDKASAISLNQVISQAFEEKQIYRIDHYLGKETVQNILFLRFANGIFEPLWNYRYIDNIQISVTESIGVEHRGAFYEKAGVIRDIVQNHIMQLIAMIAMEPPVGFEPDLIRDEKVKVFRSIRIIREQEIDQFFVRGQYNSGRINGETVNAYRAEKNVDPRSNSPTFFAGKFFIDSWRWAGVPFYVRTGKRLKKRLTEICIQFKHPPLKLFGRTCDPLEPNYLIFTIQPREAIKLHFGVKYPYQTNHVYPVNMDFSYTDAFHQKTIPEYSRLILDCLRGDLTLFVRQDGIETIWEIIDPINHYFDQKIDPDFPNYASGTNGPEKSRLLLANEQRKWISDLGEIE